MFTRVFSRVRAQVRYYSRSYSHRCTKELRNRYSVPSTIVLSVFLLSFNKLEMEDALAPDHPIRSSLQQVLRADQVEWEPSELQLRGKPWNSYHSSPFSPFLLVYPESTEDVSQILSLCSKHKVSVVVFGGGTSIEGQTLALSDRVISVDFSRMKKVLSCHENDLDITVQSGLGYIALNELIRDKGLWFPLDPGPGASIGGTSPYVTMIHRDFTVVFLHRHVCVSVLWFNSCEIWKHARECS